MHLFYMYLIEFYIFNNSTNTILQNLFIGMIIDNDRALWKIAERKNGEMKLLSVVLEIELSHRD